MLATGFFSVKKSNEDESRPTGVHILVTDPTGETIFASDNADEGKFAFAARIAGKHTTCLRNTDLVTREIELKLKSGVEAKDLSEVAQKEHLMPLATELLRLREVAEEIRKELKFLFEIEADMRDVNEETNSRTRFMTTFSVIFIIAVGSWQLIHVRKFLATKRVT